jgi:hypothetical protein
MRTSVSPAPGDPRAADLMRAAFRDVHGARLHGFALLLTLGDREQAAQLASSAIASGAARASELRHPERAAAWLRARVLRDARRLPARPRSVHDRSTVLGELGMAQAATNALAQMSMDERAALVASAVERLDAGDVATVVGRSASASRKLVLRTRQRYLGASLHWLGDAADPTGGGAIARRVQEAAASALGGVSGLRAGRSTMGDAP